MQHTVSIELNVFWLQYQEAENSFYHIDWLNYLTFQFIDRPNTRKLDKTCLKMILFEEKKATTTIQRLLFSNLNHIDVFDVTQTAFELRF